MSDAIHIDPLKILVSVCLLTYNQEDTIGQAIQCILNQKGDFLLELIIGEDCSTDKTFEIVHQFKLQYPDIIKIVKGENNKGLIRNYLDCLKACQGKYIGICAGDDYWHNEEKIIKQINFLESNQDYGVVFSDYDRLNVPGDYLIKSNIKSSSVKIYHGNVFKHLLKENFINAVCAFYRHSLLKEIVTEGLYKTEYMMEDYPLWLAFSLKSKIGYIDESLATYRHAEGTVSRPLDVQKKLNFYKSFLDVKKDYVKIGLERKEINIREAKKILYHGQYYIYSFLMKNGRFKEASTFLFSSSRDAWTFFPRYFYHYIKSKHLKKR